jgi:hypothetical protein
MTKPKTRRTRAAGGPPPPEEEPTRVFSLRGPEVRDGATYLAREDLLLIQLTEARTVQAIQAIALRRLENERLEQRHAAEKRAAQVELAALVAHGKALEDRAAVLWRELGQSYGVDFKTVTYDDETGRVMTPEEGSTDGTA